MKKIIMLISVLLGASGNLLAQWTLTTCPLGGGSASFTSNTTSVFTSTDDGHIYRSTDNGANWVAKNSGMPATCIFSVFAKGSDLYAGTLGKGIYKSTDNGENWLPANSGLSGTDTVNSLRAVGSTLLAATYHGVYTSNDNGANWTASNTGLTDLFAWTFAVKDNTAYLGTMSGGGIFRSTDNGNSWTPVNNGLTNKYIMSIAVVGDKLFAGTYGGGVFVSADNGATWIAANSGLKDLNVSTLLKVDNSVMAGTTGKGMFLYNIISNSWDAINTGLTSSGVYSSGADGANVYIGALNGVWKRSISDVPTNVSTLAKGAVSIYPTVSHGIFSVRAPESEKQMDIEVVNALGQTIYKSHIANVQQQKIDISAQPKGGYVVNVFCGTDKFTGKITVE